MLEKQWREADNKQFLLIPPPSRKRAEKAKPTPQKEKWVTAEELMATTPVLPAKANPLEAFGLLFVGANPKAAASPVAKVPFTPTL